MNQQLHKYKPSFQLNEEYKQLLKEIKSRLQKAQLRAAMAVNRELIQFYWEVGSLIIERQKETRRGDKLFEALSSDLSKSFPGTKGFSKTNLKNMRSFAAHYPNGEFSQALPDQLTWTHHVVLLQMIDVENLTIKQMTQCAGFFDSRAVDACNFLNRRYSFFWIALSPVAPRDDTYFVTASQAQPGVAVQIAH